MHVLCGLVPKLAKSGGEKYENWVHGMGSFYCYMLRGLGIRLDWASPVSDISPMMNSDNIYLQLGDRNPPFLVVDGIPRHWNDAVHDSKISEVEIMADSFTVLSDFQELMALYYSNLDWNLVQNTNESPVTLMGLDYLFNTPIYFGTDNLGAAQSVRTDEIWPDGSIGIDMNGTGTMIGMWDSPSGVRTNHLQFREATNLVVSRVSWKDSEEPTGNDTHPTAVAGTLVAAGSMGNSFLRGMSYNANLSAYDWDYDLSELLLEAIEGLRISNHSYNERVGWDYIEGEWNWFGDPDISGTEDFKFGLYMTYDFYLDEALYHFQPLLSVRSAGNKYANYGPGTSVDHWEFHEVEGSKIDVWTNTYRPNNGTNGYDLLPPTACAKNQLVVGAIYKNTNGYVTTNDIILADFSAVGPTDDGRIKPDIVAPGVEISTTKNTSFSAYSTNENGTSFAAPAVAGSLNLIRKQHEDIFGTNQMILSSSLRALAIHTATPATTNGAPDYRHGWGAFNAEACAELVKYNEKDVPTPEALGIPPSSIETNMEIYVISPILYASSNSIESYYDSPDGPMIRSVAVNYNLGTNETRAGLQYVKDFLLPEGEEINFPVTPLGGEPLMVTIAWSDYPGTPPSAIVNPTNLMLVNDLDLRLISPSGTTNFPWVLDPANPSAPATKGDNFRDNVEKVLIENPEAGEYTVMVTHKGELEQGHQFVSMVLSGHQPDEWSAPGLYNVTPYPIDNMMTVGWNAIPGFSYYIMARTNMIFGNWNSLAVVNALTDQMEVTIPLYTNTLYFTLGGGQSGVYQ
ncbi:MAG TPA: S8 family serine peptidase [Kiritimatiellia bacterium]|nr:S8 family serine peptidase [Kiritimatiellia bacterium]